MLILTIWDADVHTCKDGLVDEMIHAFKQARI